MRVELLIPALRIERSASGARVVDAVNDDRVWRDLDDVPVDEVFARLVGQAREAGATVDVDTGDGWVRVTPLGRIVAVDPPPLVVEAVSGRGGFFGWLRGGRDVSSPAKGPEAPPQEPGPETEDREFSGRVRAQADALREERDRLAADLEAARQDALAREAGLRRELEEATARADEARALATTAAREAKKRAEVAEIDAAALRAELEALQADAGQASQHAEAELVAAREREARLREQLRVSQEQGEQASRQLAGLQEDLEENTARRNQLEAVLAEVSQEAAARGELEERIKVLDREREALAEAERAAQKEASGLKQASRELIGQLRHEVEESQRAVARAEDEAAAARRRAEELAGELEARDRDREEEIAAPVEQLRRAQQELAALRDQKGELEAEIASLSTAAAALQTDHSSAPRPRFSRRSIALVAGLAVVVVTGLVAWGVWSARTVPESTSHASAVAVADVSDAHKILEDAAALASMVGDGVASDLVHELGQRREALSSLIERGTTDQAELEAVSQRVADAMLEVKKAWLIGIIAKGQELLDASDGAVGDSDARSGLEDALAVVKSVQEADVPHGKLGEAVDAVDEAMVSVSSAMQSFAAEQARKAEDARKAEQARKAEESRSDKPAPVKSGPGRPARPAPDRQPAPAPAPPASGRVTNIRASVTASGDSATITVVVQASGQVSTRPTATIGGKTVSLSGPGSFSGQGAFSGSVSLPAGTHAWSARVGGLVTSGSIRTF